MNIDVDNLKQDYLDDLIEQFKELEPYQLDLLDHAVYTALCEKRLEEDEECYDDDY